MPRKHSAGPSGPASAVWLNTTSSITSRPARCSASTIDLNSATWPPGWPARTAAEYPLCGAKKPIVL